MAGRKAAITEVSYLDFGRLRRMRAIREKENKFSPALFNIDVPLLYGHGGILQVIVDSKEIVVLDSPCTPSADFIRGFQFDRIHHYAGRLHDFRKK